MNISVIIPVFNASRTLKASLDSLKAQVCPDVEFIFIDDGSTDDSALFLQGFIQENPAVQCRLIQQENQGAAAARNRGIEAARGTWIVFLDADDRFCSGTFSFLKNELTDDIDILGWDWLNERDGKVRRMTQADYSTPAEALMNLMGGTMKWNLWLFAIRRELIDSNDIRFVPGADMGEDMAFMLKSFACAKSVRQIHQTLYVYNASNPASISNTMNKVRRKEVSANMQSAEAFLSNSMYRDLCKAYTPHLKLFIKLPLLISTSSDDYRLWHSWFPEANEYAFKNTKLPLRIRLLQWFAAKRMWSFVRFYNVLVYSILYRFTEKEL